MKFPLFAFLLLPGMALAQQPPYGPGAPPVKYKNFGGNTAGASGNGADTTEDLLTNCAFAMPIGVLPNVGDVFQVTLGGKFTSSTDNKTVRVRLGTTIAGVPIVWTGAATAVNQTGWVVVMRWMKTSLNNQNVAALSSIGANANAFSGTSFNTGTLQETLLNNFVVTGQNATNPVANSITCQYMQTEYFGAN